MGNKKISTNVNKIKNKTTGKYIVKDLRELVSGELMGGTYKSITIACIGTDRSTGDSLGPLVGTFLEESNIDKEKIHIIGNLENPLHAQNIVERIKLIEPDSFVIAVDACLGDVEDLDQIYIKNSSLTPGAALDKGLPPIGAISIKGIVNVHGCLEFMTLQNTRLYKVFELAKCISQILKDSLHDIEFEIEQTA